MASRRKVTQDDLRKAMNEAKNKKSAVKKIESPLAKYTESGQLMCILCKTIVRSEAVWPIHLNSRSHKECIELAKKSMSERGNSKQTSIKRAVSPSGESNKRIKSTLKNSSEAKTLSNLPPDFFDSSFKHPTAASIASKASEKSEIPRAERLREGGPKEAMDAKDDANIASLPEGFFDDPRMDAKVRNVDYKDPIEEEWDKFQKEIKEEAAQSAQIIADDQEEATTVRQLDEIEEQMRNWTRVMDFVKLKNEFRTSEKKTDSMGENESTDEDEDYDEFLDWRAKNSY